MQKDHKKVCLKINGKQSVKLKSSSIKFKNHFKELAVPFKIYVDFESILKWIKRNNRKNDTLCTEKYQDHIPCSFAYMYVLMIDLASQFFFTVEKMQSIYLLKEFLKSVIIAKKNNKKAF